MIKESKIKLYLYILCIALLALMPSSISTSFTITMGHRIIRLNVIMVCIILLITGFRDFVLITPWKRYEKIYFLFCVLVFIISLGKIMGQVETVLFFSVVEAMIVLLIPFVLYKRLSVYEEEQNISIIFKSIIGIGILVAIQVLMNNFFAKLMNWSDTLGRAVTTVGASTTTALYLYAIMVISFYKMLNSKEKFYKITTLTLFMAILVTQTRSAIVLVVLFLIYSTFISSTKSTRRYIVIFCFVLVIVYISKPDIINNILERFFTEKSNGSNLERTYLINEGIQKIFENPIMGTGIGMGITRLADDGLLQTQINNPHNQHIGLLIETGVLGYFSYITFIISMISFYRKKVKQNNKIYLLFALITLIIVGYMFETLIIVDIRSAMSFWIIMIALSLNDDVYINNSDKMKKINV